MSHDPFVRAATILALFIVAAAVSAGATAAHRTARTIKPADLPAILDPKPKVPKWTFELGDSYIFPIPAHDPAFTLHEWLGEKPRSDRRALAAKLQRDGFVIGRHRRWGGETKVQQPSFVQRLGADAVFFAFLFRDAAGAHAGFQALLPTVAAPKKLSVTGLGDDAVAGSDEAENHGALYLWRRANLVVAVEWLCDAECGFRVGPPARTYALEIVARAKVKS